MAYSSSTYSSVEAAAREIGVSKPTLLRALARGDVPGRRVGRRWLLSKAAIAAWLAGVDQPAETPGRPA